jgi:mRNA-degrading endonuclease RelE of RelBE toxin-antitoxin system
MKHFAGPSFWELYERLPDSIRELADKNFKLLKTDPNHPSLHLKKAGKYWSARVGIKYRVLGIDVDKGVLWFWIGPHAEYDKIVR